MLILIQKDSKFTVNLAIIMSKLWTKSGQRWMGNIYAFLYAILRDIYNTLCDAATIYAKQIKSAGYLIQ